MRRLQYLLLLTLVLVLGACAQVDPGRIHRLDEYTAKAAGFKVDVPCVPREEVSVEDAYKNGKQYSYMYRCSNGATSLLIGFIDHNPDTPATIEKRFGYATGDYEFIAKKLNIRKSEVTSVGAFPAKSYIVSGNSRLYYVLVATNRKGSLTAVISFPDESVRSVDDVKMDESMAAEVIKSISFLSK